MVSGLPGVQLEEDAHSLPGTGVALARLEFEKNGDYEEEERSFLPFSQSTEANPARHGCPRDQFTPLSDKLLDNQVRLEVKFLAPIACDLGVGYYLW